MTLVKLKPRLRALRSISLGVAVAGMLAACGGARDDDAGADATVRLVNATLSHPTLDMSLNSQKIVSTIGADTVSSYLPVGGTPTFQITDGKSGATLATSAAIFSEGSHYALIAFEQGGTVKTAILNEDFAAPSPGQVQIRVLNVASDAGRLDVYVTDPAVNLNAVSQPSTTFGQNSGASSGLLTFASGKYRVRVTAAGNKADLRLDIPSITLATQQTATVLLTPTAGGTLINGSTLIQQGAYTAARNPNARVRLAAAVGGSATVSASAGTSVIDAGSTSPSFGFYSVVPAGGPLNISVNGQSLAAPAALIAAGTDVTLLVYGNSPTTAAVSIITDDNRTPSDPSTVKLRLMNGVAGHVGSLTLTANTVPVGASVTFGAVSGYAAVPLSTSPTNLTLTSSLVGGTLYVDSTNTFNTSLTRTILVGGPVTTPTLLIR